MIRGKRTFKVNFLVEFIPLQKYRFLPDYVEINPLFLKQRVTIFCKENEIKCKKIVVHNCFSNRYSFVKIYGTKEDQAKVYDFLRFNFNKYIHVECI